MGRHYEDDHFWFLKKVVKQASDDVIGGLAELCIQAKCESGRASIRSWLDGRKNANGENPPRALPLHIAKKLLDWLVRRSV